jgi:membrane-bound lytic murein transglycosylase B
VGRAAGVAGQHAAVDQGEGGVELVGEEGRAAAMFDAIERRYGVPAGPLLAIWGMETGFGAVRGNVNTHDRRGAALGHELVEGELEAPLAAVGGDRRGRVRGVVERRYGVPAGPLLAIWGMETGFGAVRGNVNTLSAVATLAYDCPLQGPPARHDRRGAALGHELVEGELEAPLAAVGGDLWGMETGFGAVRGNVNTLSAVATLAYDCRRSAFFRSARRGRPG